MDVALNRPITYWDGFVFVFLLALSRFGFWLKTYGDIPTRQWVCSGLGFIIASLILDDDVGSFVLITFTTISLICMAGPRFCHIVAFAMMFGYLSIFRLQRGESMGLFANYLIATTTLNLAGVAFEINKAFRMKEMGISPPPRPVLKKFLEDEPLKLNFMDIFHYTYSYSTILTGPYVRYQVYADFIQVPYAILYKRPNLAEDRTFRTIPYLIVSFWILHVLWPTSYIFTTDYTMRGVFHKMVFSAILFFKFRLVTYVGSCLMEQMNKYAGMGMYERHCKCLSVHGPTQYGDNLQHLMARRFINVPTDIELESETINVTKPLLCEASNSISDSFKYWNNGLLYWLEEYIYKGLLDGIDNFTLRYILTAAVCVLWYGPYLSFIILGITSLYYIHVESIFLEINKEVNTTVSHYNSLDVGLWLSKQLIFSWCLMPYFLPNMSQLLVYYKSTYFLPLFFLMTMHFVGYHIITPSSKRHNTDNELSESESFIEFKF